MVRHDRDAVRAYRLDGHVVLGCDEPDAHVPVIFRIGRELAEVPVSFRLAWRR
jgi:hypothetical protein